MLGWRGIVTATVSTMLASSLFLTSRAGAQKAQKAQPTPSSITGTWEAKGDETGPWIFNLLESQGLISGRLWQDGGLSEPVSFFDGRIIGGELVLKYRAPSRPAAVGTGTITITGILQKDEIVFTSQVDPAPRGGRAGGQRGLLGAGLPKRFKVKRGDAAVWGATTVEHGLPRPALRIEFINSNRKRFELVQKPASGRPPNSVAAPNLRQFMARLPIGTYTLTVGGLPNGYFVKTIEVNGADLGGRPLRILPDLPAPELAIAIGVTSGAPWSEVHGRVTNVDRRVQITTVPSRMPQRLSFPPTSVELTNAAFSEPWIASLDNQGRFDFTRILPGTYQLRFLPDPTRKNYRTVTISSGSNRLELVAPDIDLGCPVC